MTSESKSDTEPWIAKHKAAFPYAYEKGSVSRFFQIAGLPHAVLVDATGKVVWRGHPAGLQSSVVESAVRGALPMPMWEWTGEAKPVRTALMAKQYAKALEAAAKLTEAHQGPAIRAAIQAQIEGRVAAMKADSEAGNFLDAHESAKALVKDLAGLPEAQEAQARATGLEADKEAQTVIAGQKKVRKIRDGELRKKKEIQKAIEDLEKLQDQYVGTHAAKEASELLERLTKKRNES